MMTLIRLAGLLVVLVVPWLPLLALMWLTTIMLG